MLADKRTGAGGAAVKLARADGVADRQRNWRDEPGNAGNGGENAISLRRQRRCWQVRRDWSGCWARTASRSRRRIKVGLTDGASTEVVEGNLKEGEMVITGQTISGAQDDRSTQTQRQDLVARHEPAVAAAAAEED